VPRDNITPQPTKHAIGVWIGMRSTESLAPTLHGAQLPPRDEVIQPPREYVLYTLHVARAQQKWFSSPSNQPIQPYGG